MNLIRQEEFFSPVKTTDDIHIIGIGAIGSHIAEMLVRMGLTNIHLYDFDTVEEHNIPNQMYFDTQAVQHLHKTTALYDTCKAINPDCIIKIHDKGYILERTKLSGYVFLCVDSINLRKAVVKEHEFNPMIKALFDFRMGLEDAQHYAADWKDHKHVEDLLASMDFTDEEAKEAMPTTACGSALCVLPTIRVITSYGIANWINFIKTGKLKKVILANAFNFENMAFPKT